jgi:hypothetical protein
VTGRDNSKRAAIIFGRVNRHSGKFIMSDAKHLAEVKRALSAKYANLARLAGSTPKQKQFQTRADKHRRQAEQFERMAGN